MVTSFVKYSYLHQVHLSLLIQEIFFCGYVCWCLHIYAQTYTLMAEDSENPPEKSVFPISSDISGGFRSLVYSKIRTWVQVYRRSRGSCRIPFSISEGTGALASVVF